MIVSTSRRAVPPVLLLVVLLGAALPSTGWTQRAPAAADEPTLLEVDPIRCWWRTSTGAVRTGERFSLDLTCAVLENEVVHVVPDESRLGGNVIQLAPFEVVDSTHPPDLRSRQRRFFQYQYTLRIINPDQIGKDVPIPNMSIRYRVTSRLPGNASLQGRDLTYLLPPQSIRVLSMVPGDTSDIRDASGQPFGDVETLTFRARVLDIVAATLVALGSLMTLVVLVRLARGGRLGTRVGERMMTPWRSARLAASELSAVRRQAEAQGWNDALVGRALAALRVASAIALGRPISQRAATAKAHAGDGRLVARDFRGRGAKLISSSVTAEDLAGEIARLPADAPARQRQTLEGLHGALATFDRSLYGRDAALERDTLDVALAAATTATRRLGSQHMWPKGYLRRWRAGPAEPQREI